MTMAITSLGRRTAWIVTIVAVVFGVLYVASFRPRSSRLSPGAQAKAIYEIRGAASFAGYQAAKQQLARENVALSADAIEQLARDQMPRRYQGWEVGLWIDYFGQGFAAAGQEAEPGSTITR